MGNAFGHGLLWYGVFLFSVTLHEASHAKAALSGGDPTAYQAGQVTLDPIPHIRRSPVGMIVLPILSVLLFGFPMGFASAPYDPLWADRYPRRAGWMALAGPLANFVLLVVAGLGIHLGIALEGFSRPDSADYLHVMESAASGPWPALGLILSMLFSLNLILLLFNLLPVPPLDGMSVATLFLKEDLARRVRAAASSPAFAWLGILVAWRLFPILFRPVFVLALNTLYPGASFE
ncbi:MAG: site-2 protease family protein [Candidatus Eisenbacteria bacterium]|nr:site-2 protease family protein [Candidatus Eisenbacteria bacterium]